MTNREKIKDAYEKLHCFQNPLLEDLAEQLEEAYKNLYGGDVGVSVIISKHAKQNKIPVQKIIGGSRDEELVYIRYQIAHEAHDKGFTVKQIAQALNRGSSAISHYLHYYSPPAKFTSD